MVVDRYHLFDVNHPRESTDSASGNMLQGSFNTAEDQDSYNRQLNGRYSVSDTQGFPQMGYYIRIYDKGKRLLESSDQPFEIELPLGVYTIVVSPCNEEGGCYQGRNAYRVSFSSLN